MFLKNYMEDLVWEQLDDVIAGYPNACCCEQCRYDIAALALNMLPTRYVVTTKGETYAKVRSIEQQYHIDLITAITQAIVAVSLNPRHSKK